ncbi:hypothetical protein ZIOFF_043611 [Zingiber officinale]|uniref:O-fucosyltransferase family protein n=1 Tax=Zingiber officinale TaxID=94328 RepID=A0A8J5FVA0_ZINOF|nr:hypothetical protein ZIOFF_043611 [Zingiber officinale]
MKPTKSRALSPPAAGRPWHCRRGGKPRDDHPDGGPSVLCRLIPSLLFLAALVAYLLGLWYCASFFSALGSTSPTPPPPLGSVYRSNELFQKLLPEMLSDNSSAAQINKIWTNRRKLKQSKHCTIHKTQYSSGSIEPSGYLIVDANGGLNQQRSSICNAVALAGLLNAILVIPKFHVHNIWMDPRQCSNTFGSKFKDIYDEDHFINTLKGYVKVVKELPEMIVERFGYNTSSIPNLKAKAWATARFYSDVALPLLQEHGVIRIAPFANRLEVEVPSDMQRLRCLANFKAISFSPSIATMATKLIYHMKEKSSLSEGNYVAVHLRFEADMVAFSCCIFDGGMDEKVEMDSARQRGWKKFKLQSHCLRPDLNRMQGKCPLTPLEVGMMLRGMGFNNNTPIYLASGKIYKEETHLAPLLQLFPLLQTKQSLATPEELVPFQDYSSRLAALDYSVCLHSEVFVTTQGGNFPQFMIGHRRFLYGGHSKTIKPNKRKLVMLFQDANINWKSFKEEMEGIFRESERKGMAQRKNDQSVYSSPLPDCTCLQDQIIQHP